MTYRETSRQAYAGAKIESNEDRLIDMITRVGADGITCDEFIARTGIPHQSASPVFTALTLRGVLMRTRTKRETRAGYKAAVYVLAPPGNLFRTPQKSRADRLRDVIASAWTARDTGDWSDFDEAFSSLTQTDQNRCHPATRGDE
jgi:hypothetical protein